MPDYEFEGFNERSADWSQATAAFDETQSPDLPRGLNAATQFDWLERHGHDLRGKCLLPYPQYWAWWLSGVAASEPSSLGCHTHLWNPAAGTYSALAQSRGVMAVPGFEPQGGPFREQAGHVVDAQGPVALTELSAPERATLAALYCAQVTAWVVDHLGGLSPLVVEGPFARNMVYTQVLAQLCGPSPVFTSTDALEGTARGAWMLTHGTEPGINPAATAPVSADDLAGLQLFHQRWPARFRHLQSGQAKP